MDLFNFKWQPEACMLLVPTAVFKEPLQYNRQPTVSYQYETTYPWQRHTVSKSPPLKQSRSPTKYGKTS